jgi:MSHA pilin protein MshD
MSITRRLPAREHGLTLVELVMFIVIVSVAVAGVLQVLNITSRSSADPQVRKQALAIAEGLLEEIEAAHFTYCDPLDDNAETAADTAGCAAAGTRERRGPETGNTRPYDNVNDYVTQFGVPQSAFNSGGVLVDAAGTPIGVGGAYAATLTITPEPLNGIPSAVNGADPPDMSGINVLRLTVTVSYGSGSVSLDGYRVRYAPNAVP